MNDADLALYQQAQALANAGQYLPAYEMFRGLRERNPDIEILFGIATTTSNPTEARQAINTIKFLQPNHPKLSQLEALHHRKLQVATAYGTPGPILSCPYCGFQGQVLVRDKISTGGIVTLVILLIVFFPLFWVGLLIKDNYYVCSRCGSRITMAG